MKLQDKINELTRENIKLKKNISSLEKEVFHLEMLLKLKSRALHKLNQFKDLVINNIDWSYNA